MKENYSDPRLSAINQILWDGGSKEFEIKIIDDKIIINGDISISHKCGELPYKIYEVYGNVIIDNCKEPPCYGALKSLKNFPTKIHGNFICKMNPNLVSLEGGPEIVDKDFHCVGCGLKSIEHLPKFIGGNLLLYNNDIKDLSPILNSQIYGTIDAQFNPCESTELYAKLLNEHKLSVI